MPFRVFRKLLIWFTLFFFQQLVSVFAESQEAENYKSLCANVWLQKDFNEDFSDMEERLLCGDGSSDAIGQSWAVIPANQAQVFMKSFLQSRGFHEPRFVQKDGRLYADPGKKSVLSRMIIHTPPEEWSVPRKREIKGRDLTPKLLDELQGWANLEIKNNGFPCGKITSQATTSTGEVDLFTQAGVRRRLVEVVDTRDLGLDRGVLDRYNAFRKGDWYSEMKVRLTQSRIIEDGVLQTLIMKARCRPDDVIVERDAILGPPHQFRLGFGANTEDGPRIRATARQTRLWRNASSAEANVLATFKRQAFDANLRWYYSPKHTRSYVQPTFRTDLEKENAYSAQTTEFVVYHGWNEDLENSQIILRLGPNWQRTLVTEGAAFKTSTIVMADVNATWTTHTHEFFRTSPRKGALVDAGFLSAFEKWGADLTAQRVRVTGQYLWNVANFDPPLLVLGFRLIAGSVLTQKTTSQSTFPLRFLFFGGGNADLRGFERQSLPPGGAGALSAVVGSTEARFYRAIVRRVDPFVFTDMGQLGNENFQLLRPTYFSPGFGLRWESPIGVFRGMAALPYVLEAPQGIPMIEKKWRFSFTFGEEF